MNIFFVMSPFQYICAEEARATYNSRNNILILTTKHRGRSTQQLLEMIDKSKWDKIILYKGLRTLYFSLFLTKLRKLNGSNNFNTFFFAVYNSWDVNVIKSNLKFNKHVFFDDGTNTIYEYEKYIKNKKGYSRKNFWRDIMLRIQGNTPPNNVLFFENLEIFTMFDIDTENIKITKNSFQELKKTLPKNEYYKKNAPVGILGQGAVGQKSHISKKEYLNIIKKIAHKHENLIYFPHRTESEEVKNEIFKIKNLTYHNSTYPIEYEIARKNIQLSKLYGIMSTAFYTLHALYPSIELELLEIDYDKYLSAHDSEVFSTLTNHAKKHLIHN